MKKEKNEDKLLTISNSIKNLNIFFLFLSIIIKMEADNFFYENIYYPSWSIFRHIFFAASLVLMGYVFFKFAPKKLLFFREFVILSVLSIIVILTSMLYILHNGGNITISLKYIYFMYSAGIYAFLILNTLSKSEITKTIKHIFIITIILYFTNTYDKFLDFTNFTKISFMQSNSPFESSAFSGYFYGFMVFFTLAKEERKWSILAVIMNILAFKRINVVFSILFFVISFSKKGYHRVPKIVIYLLIGIFSILPLIQFRLMTPSNLAILSNFFGFENVHDFLMGRDRFFYAVMNSGYKPAGFGSATSRLQSITGNGMEMDGLSTYMEIGLFGSFIFSLSFWKIAGRNFRNVLLMFIFFLNFMTSSQIIDTYALFLQFITITFININTKNFNQESIMRNGQGIKG